jgi:hypothetical protein
MLMKKVVVALLVLAMAVASSRSARADKAIGAVFGYPGSVGVSFRTGPIPINAAWSSEFFHFTVDKWMMKKRMKEDKEGRLAWYLGPGADAGIPLEDTHDFFLAARVPIGLQFMLTPKLETFGEIAPGLQILDETDFYWASSVGIRFVLGQ